MLKMLLFFFITIFAFAQYEFVFARDVYQTDGVVRLLNANKNIAGAGTIIKLDEETQTVYILTAYHVIEDIKGSGSPIYVEFHAGGRTRVKEAKDNQQWQWIVYEEEKDGFAVIYVEDYPEDMVLSVIFIDDLSEEMVLDEVTTFGYDYDGAPLTTKGPISSLEPILRYDAGMVRPGFSGGPVLNQEGFIIGTNLKLIETYKDVFAIRAKVFKPVIDSWISLPRMQLGVSIDDPTGAKNGTVSTEQEFYIKVSVREDRAGNLVGPKVKLTLNIPEGYQIIEGAKTVTVSLHREGRWKIKAPDKPKVERSITVNTRPEAKPSVEPIRITTVKRAELKPEITKPKSSGLTLFVGGSLNVQAVVKNSGGAKLKESGALKIDFQPHEFDLVDGNIEQPFVVDKPVKWKLRAKSETKSGNIAVNITAPGEDENGMTAEVITPLDSISAKVKYFPRWRTYVGFPSVLIAEDVAVEVELGAKVRLFNIFRKGIPLYVVMSGAFGIDDIIGGIESAQDAGEVTPVFDQQHALGTLSLAIPLGPISLQAGSGRSFYFGENDFDAWHVAMGMELNLERLSIQGGIRHVYEEDLSFFIVQIKF